MGFVLSGTLDPDCGVTNPMEDLPDANIMIKDEEKAIEPPQKLSKMEAGIQIPSMWEFRIMSKPSEEKIRYKPLYTLSSKRCLIMSHSEMLTYEGHNIDMRKTRYVVVVKDRQCAIHMFRVMKEGLYDLDKNMNYDADDFEKSIKLCDCCIKEFKKCGCALSDNVPLPKDKLQKYFMKHTDFGRGSHHSLHWNKLLSLNISHAS